MDDFYDRQLCNISKTHREQAIRILNTLRISCGPLTFQELVDVCAVDLQNAQLNRNQRLSNPDDFIAIYAGLIDFETIEKDIEDGAFVDVQLRLCAAQPGLLEYLQSNRIKHRQTSGFAPDLKTAHTKMAQICLINLLDEHLATSQLNEETLKQLPFARYAAANWYHHYSYGDRTDKLSLRLVEKLFVNPQKNFKNWVRLHDMDNNKAGSGSSLNRKLDDIPSPLYYASLLGLTKTLAKLLVGEEMILSGHGCARESSCGKYGTPLQAAAAEGHLEAVTCLLDNGYDANASGGHLITALNAAVSKGWDQIVKVLISKGAHVTTRLYKGESVLHWAAFNSFDNILRMLLDHEPNLYMKDWDWRTPLHWAVAQGNLLASMLLAKHNDGMYLSVRDIYGWTALHLAVSRCEWADNFTDAKALVKTLLEAGANQDIRSYSGKSCEDEVNAFGEFDTFQHVQAHKKGDIIFTNRKQQMLDLLREYNRRHEILLAIRGRKAAETGEHKAAASSTRKLQKLVLGKAHTSEWASLRPWVSEVLKFPYATQKIGRFMTAYNIVHEHCLCQQPSWAKSEPASTKIPSRDIFDPSRIYQELRNHLHDHVKDVVSSLAAVEPANILTWYLSEWDKFMTAHKKITHVFRYLDRHVVCRLIDEGHKRLYHIEDVHMAEWKRQFFIESPEWTRQSLFDENPHAMRKLVFDAIEEYTQDDKTPDPLNISLLKSVTQLIWPEKLTVERLVSYMRPRDKRARERALKLLLEWGTDVRYLKLVNTTTMEEWPPIDGLDLLIDLLDPKVKIKGEDNKHCDTIRAAFLTSETEAVSSVTEITHADMELIAKQFDGDAMETFFDRRGFNLIAKQELLVAAATNPTHAVSVTLALFNWCRRWLKVTEHVIEAAVQNPRGGLQLVTLLLAWKDNDVNINEKIVEAAVQYRGRDGPVPMVQLLYDHQPDHFRVNENALKAAAQNTEYGLELITFLLEKCEDQVTVTNRVIHCAIKNFRFNLPIVKLLLEQRGDEFRANDFLMRAIPRRCRHENELKSLLLDAHHSRESMSEVGEQAEWIESDL